MAIEGITRPPNAAVDAERRRSGRPAAASPHLIPLLRSPQLLDGKGHGKDPVRFGSDQSAPARGIMVAVVISAVLWLGILAAMRALL